MMSGTMAPSQHPCATRLAFASARIVHITMPPHEPDGYTSTTEPFTIGISYTGHSKAIVDDGSGRATARAIEPGASSITSRRAVTWLRVAEPSEALEIRPSNAELSAVAHALDADWIRDSALVDAGRDPVIWGICTRYRRAALGATPIDELRSSELVHTLLVHVCIRHLGARKPRAARGRLDARRLARVTSMLESSLRDPPTLRPLASAAALSPFHFQRLFRATTGLTPHQYVMARRMEHARALLIGSNTKVIDVAADLGFSDVAHFRRAFRRQFNRSPRAR